MFGCEAKINMREVIKFPQFAIPVCVIALLSIEDPGHIAFIGEYLKSSS
jgi:hypothetical protein